MFQEIAQRDERPRESTADEVQHAQQDYDDQAEEYERRVFRSPVFDKQTGTYKQFCMPFRVKYDAKLYSLPDRHHGKTVATLPRGH